MTEATSQEANPLVETGIAGLDDVLHGGLPPNRLYVVDGGAGVGKTTLALQFLLAGVRRGERVLYVSLSESAEELAEVFQSHGWSMQGIEVVELATSEDSLKPDAGYTMFHPSEVELTETTKRILAEAERVRPARLVLDSLSEVRLLAQNLLRYRRHLQALKQFFGRRECTVLLVDDRRGDEEDMHLLSLAHGVLSLERRSPEYGTLRRRLQVVKVRGRTFREGYHDFRIRRGGLEVYPRLVAAEHHAPVSPDPLKSGLESLDTLLGGGLARGTSTLILGPAGTGKSSLAAQFTQAAAARGDSAAVFLFDELVHTFLLRSAGLGIDLAPLLTAGRLIVRQIDPAELSPGEFAHAVRQSVERFSARLVVIDSLNGYFNAMPSEKLLLVHLHELLAYLGQQGVTTILLLAQHGLLSAEMASPVDTSYLADTVLVVRFFEAAGEVHRAISVIKKRTGNHERTVREMSIESDGIVIGQAIRDFQGVLSGRPMPIQAGQPEAWRDDDERS